LERLKATFGLGHPLVARALSHIASARQSLSDIEQAKTLYEQALAIQRSVLGNRHPDCAETLNNLASLLAATGCTQESLVLLNEALEIDRLTLGPNHPLIAIGLHNLGVLFQRAEQFIDAEESLLEAKRILVTAGQGEQAESAAILSTLASLYSTLGRYDEALECCQDAHAIQLVIFGKDHTSSLATVVQWSRLLNLSGHPDAARLKLEDCIERQVTSLGEWHRDIAISSNVLGMVHLALGNNALAIPCFLRTLRIHRRRLGRRHRDYATTLNNLGEVCRRLGRLSRAELLFLRESEIVRSCLGEHHIEYAISLNNLGLLYAATDRRMDGQRAFERALEIAHAVFGSEHPTTQRILANFHDVTAC
jgi:tetratricopeptide (TPR) repeat protein